MSSDASEAEADADADAGDEGTNALLFERWAVDDLVFRDPSTERYINATPIAHTMGRHTDKQFKKSDISIVERLVNRLMQTDENTGKKQLTTRLVQDAFESIHQRTDENPVQILVRAVENSAPREETVRLKYGGISVPKAVDVAPQRRVDQALLFISDGVANATYKSTTSAAEALANELVTAADYDADRSYSIAQKEERERVAAAAR